MSRVAKGGKEGEEKKEKKNINKQKKFFALNDRIVLRGQRRITKGHIRC